MIMYDKTVPTSRATVQGPYQRFFLGEGGSLGKLELEARARGKGVKPLPDLLNLRRPEGRLEAWGRHKERRRTGTSTYIAVGSRIRSGSRVSKEQRMADSPSQLSSSICL
eukprot:GHVU01086812.1.p1 GENE.GHVU01086812.1~~GHVU01086812.1.p1  ORF type:complete len:110 (+),score=8.32 GHVU01086812.1:157-486(+)